MSEPLSPDPKPVPAGASGVLPVPSAAPAEPLPPAGHELLIAWSRANPMPAALLGALILTLTVFYGWVPLFYVPASHRFITLSRWISEAWNPETHYSHGPLVPFVILFLLWNALPKLRDARPVPSMAGLVPFAFGVGLYLLSARALQPRLGWGGLPFLLWGGVLYAAGWRWVRTLFFPILCVFFLIPVPGIDQATVRLQYMSTNAASIVCNAIGLKMVAVGTTLRAVDDSFQFQVIGDCSGINSLMAITLMTAVFAHLTQDRLWKMLVLFASSVPVALIGNVGRLTGIMLVAKCFGQAAGGWFDNIAAYLISFPFAFGMLCLVNKLLNWNAPPSSTGGSPRRSAPGDDAANFSAGSQPLAVAGTPGGIKTSTYDY